MNEEKSKNSFSRYVREGDWSRYQNEVSKQSNSLYQELGKKVPPLAKLDKLLLSTSTWQRIKGDLIFAIIYFMLIGPWFYFDYVQNHQALQFLLSLIPMFIIHAMMTYVLVSRDKKFARWEVLSYSLPKMIEILFFA